MKRAQSSPSSSPAAGRGRAVRRSASAFAVVATIALVLGACGGDDDTDDTTTTTTTLALDDTSTTTTTTTPQDTTTTTTAAGQEVEYVTEGASVIVANASGINGAAGRMSDRLAAVGFDMGDPTNSTEGQIETTKVYYDPANAEAQPVAESLRLALGGGDIELLELGVPAPIDGGDMGDATVLVTMGNDTADKSLEQLQGRAPAPTDTTGDTTGDTTDDTTDDTDPESTG